MSETKDKRPSLTDLTATAPESNDPAYRAWKQAKVDKALKEAEDRAALIPSDKVWSKLGVEH